MTEQTSRQWPALDWPINSWDGVKVVDLSRLRGGARGPVSDRSGAGADVDVVSLPRHAQLAQQLPGVEVHTVHLQVTISTMYITVWSEHGLKTSRCECACWNVTWLSEWVTE